MKLILAGDVRRGTALAILPSGRIGPADCHMRDRNVVIGFASKDQLDGDVIAEMFTVGSILGLLDKALPGTQYFLGPGGVFLTKDQIPDGAWVVRLGVALSDRDFWIQISYFARKTSISTNP